MKSTELEKRIASQNGEDGLIEHLLSCVTSPNKYFLEVGSGNGKKNNTTALVRKGYKGIAVDKKSKRVEEYVLRAKKENWKVSALCKSVCTDNVFEILKEMLFLNPDIFSLDIDSVDFWVCAKLLALGLKPKILVVEYNAGFLNKPITIKNVSKSKTQIHKHLDFGAGIEAWKYLLVKRYGYTYLGVESSGVNAFFVDHVACVYDQSVEWLKWSDCKAFTPFMGDAETRWNSMKHIEFVDVSKLTL